jgi:hypothetical protein
MYQGEKLSRRRFWMKPIHRGTPFILGALRCIMTEGSNFRGQEGNARQLAMFRDTYRKVKADYMKHGGLLQLLSIPEWKWDDISMDLIVGLPLTACKFDSIWVIVDRLSKSTHFIPIHTNYNVQKYAGIYIAHVLCLHRVPKMIISDRGSEFVARFWEQLQVSLRTHLIHSSAYHPQTDGQME